MRFRLKELREERGWNQTALAYHAGISVSQISLIESGKRNPSVATLKNIAEALGVGVEDLFHDSPKGQAPRPLAEGPEQRRSYPYPWMCDTLARTIDRWAVVLDAGRTDPPESYIIANAALDVTRQVLRFDVPGETLGDRVPADEVAERVALAQRLWELSERAQRHYADSEAAEPAEVHRIEDAREMIRRRTQEIAS